MKKFFKLIFGKYFSIGIILILIASILNIKVNDCFFIQIIENCLSTIGVALLLGSIFDFSKNTEDFIQFMSNIIKRIIVTKEFLTELTDEEKKNILELVITPTNTQLEECSSINHYYKKSIESFIDLYNIPFKTNLTIHLVAKIEEGIVVCEGNVSYRRYKVGNDYKPIVTSFEKMTVKY